jgi:5-formyltetrahydrofolate cyclo-ligase
MVQTKIEWRRTLLQARRAVPQDVHRRDSAAIARRVGHLPCVANARSVLGYSPIGAEVDPSAVFALDGVAEAPRYLPARSNDDVPRWLPWSAVPTERAERSTVSAAALRYPVLVLVPGVGFDSRGVRLGRGVGFYDRALAELRECGTVYAIGLSFECQVVPALPADPWDQRVDVIVTERRAIEFGDRMLLPQEVSR